MTSIPPWWSWEVLCNGRKVLLAAQNISLESEAAWRGNLDGLAGLGLRCLPGRSPPAPSRTDRFKRRIKHQTVLPSTETAAMLLRALVASGQIITRKIDRWQALGEKPADPVPADFVRIRV